MAWRDLLVDAYGRVPEFLERVLKDLSREDLAWQPRPDCNSMGWLGWHLARGVDGQIADLAGEEQLWLKDGWHEKFGRPADPKDTGFGHTPEQVAAFAPPEAAVMLGYIKAVAARGQGYIKALPEAELDRELNEPWFQPLPTLGVRLVSIIDDAILHAGQVAYVRGLRQGKGWQPY